MVNTANMPRAYAEVYSFLQALGEAYIAKIPASIYAQIEAGRDARYQPVYRQYQPVTEDGISKEALALIAALNIKYWCPDEQEKQRLKQCYITNQIKEQEKYSAKNVFQTAEKQDSVKQDRHPARVEVEPTVWQKWAKKIKDIFKGGKKC